MREELLIEAGRARLDAWREQWFRFTGVVDRTLAVPPFESGDDNEHVEAGH